MIIIEGADNTGKSTLLSQLLAMDPSLRVLRRERFRPERGESIGSSYLQALMPPGDGNRQLHANSIADRFLASECIYGPLFRQGCRMTAREHFVIKSILLSYGAFVVYCDPPSEVVTSNWTEREQMYAREPLSIYHAYKRKIVPIFHPIPVWHYDWTRADAIDQRVDIIQYHHKQLQQYHLNLSWPVQTCADTVSSFISDIDTYTESPKP